MNTHEAHPNYNLFGDVLSRLLQLPTYNHIVVVYQVLINEWMDGWMRMVELIYTYMATTRKESVTSSAHRQVVTIQSCTPPKTVTFIKPDQENRAQKYCMRTLRFRLQCIEDHCLLLSISRMLLALIQYWLLLKNYSRQLRSLPKINLLKIFTPPPNPDFCIYSGTPKVDFLLK